MHQTSVTFCQDKTVINVGGDCILTIPLIPEAHRADAQTRLRHYWPSCVNPRDFGGEKIRAVIPLVDSAHIGEKLDAAPGMIEFTCGPDIGSFASTQRFSPSKYSRSLGRAVKEFFVGETTSFHDLNGNPRKISIETLKKYCAALKLTGDELRGKLGVAQESWV